jgi:hypothetical protein
MNPENWNWAMWTLVALCLLSWFASVSMHGRPRDPHNGWARTVHLLVWFILLYFAGALA